MQSCKLWVVQYHIGNHNWISRDEVDDAWGYTRFLKYIHDDFGRKHLMIAWFPNHNVAHKGRGGTQIACNGGEIKRGHGIDKAFKWSVF